MSSTVEAARLLVGLGVRAVVSTLGGSGAVLVTALVLIVIVQLIQTLGTRFARRIRRE